MKISRLMLGTVQFGLNYGIANKEGKPSYENSKSIIKTAFENDINTFDTAAAYGDSEKVIGKALKELGINNKVMLITKVPPVPEGMSSIDDIEKFITSTVEKSLKRLGVETLEACLFHNEDDFKFMDVLFKLKDRGYIVNAGVSIDTNKYCSEILESDVGYIQLPYNIFDNRFDSYFGRYNANGVTLFSRSVYLQGLLLMPEENINESLNVVIPVRRQLESLAVELEMSMAELCMRFVLSNDAITSVLTGVDTVEQLRQNVLLFNKGSLSKEVLKAIKGIVPVFEERVVRPTLW
jgi:aryl-alcohol dehydrogenase-like predicted oxidoreductase